MAESPLRVRGSVARKQLLTKSGISSPLGRIKLFCSQNVCLNEAKKCVLDQRRAARRQHPGPGDIRAVIMTAAQPLGLTGPSSDFGAGLVNAYRTVKLLDGKSAGEDDDEQTNQWGTQPSTLTGREGLFLFGIESFRRLNMPLPDRDRREVLSTRTLRQAVVPIRWRLLIGNLSQSQEVTPLSPHSIMHWLLESAMKKIPFPPDFTRRRGLWRMQTTVSIRRMSVMLEMLP